MLRGGGGPAELRALSVIAPHSEETRLTLYYMPNIATDKMFHRTGEEVIEGAWGVYAMYIYIPHR